MIHDLLENIATSHLLTWVTLNIVAPLDRRLMALSNGRLSLTGASTILLITIGARSGAQRRAALPGLFHDGEIVLLASKGGAKTHPAWYHNLLKHPEVEVVKAGERLRYRAEVTEGQRREALWSWMLEQWKGFAAYQEKSKPRVLPVVVLHSID
ncbi:MAG: nitroreductase family deazaflavin-dependent oxidoreductase [Deltaproteobacteria bacterium]|nr:nitroreductase family deazaflavin-dependent oxidoreductase [Deltaproteobacteria bacterium]MBW2361851.1 nitroreductase family deazaflavin-dependent oxidoreductase [Deltaproteobacteria bacterium]